MKKTYRFFTTVFLVAIAACMTVLLTACGNSSSSSESDVPDQAKLDAIVSSIEAVNEVPNARAIDDFSLENEMGLTPDNILAYKGDVTNDQADCALVFAAQAKSGTVDTVKSELEAYKESMSSTLYAEFADKVAKAQDCRIVVKDNIVVMVISGINGPDYSEIDTAIEEALA
ncbi:MAG: DUF4358 domain-containing protein [Gemmiger sp.]|uniref:DUF4358 domain-containing protein n=1 Tax=Gemmiger sp. TaxID=2049027 RepID=UPI002E7A8841|nr:DUF4358 domain-containing protein [Gemmiger sp.]MEE0801811.1 DUF4358 domain-containing protein [Gemmiger sp.]